MVSELERQRLENIERNRKALLDFKLREASKNAFGDKEVKKSNGPKLGATKKRKRDVPTPPRRVRNLRRHGIKEEEFKQIISEPKIEIKEEEKNQRMEGELKLNDYINNSDWDQALSVMKNLGSNQSMGDWFSKDTEISNPSISQLRDELNSKLVADDRDIKVVPERITSLCFHPMTDKAVVFAGDKYGGMGLWDTSKEDDNGLVNMNYHTKNITNIVIDPQDGNKVFSSSHDCSIRMLDLASQVNEEIFVAHDDEGITDFHLVDNNLVYYSTLLGYFGVRDIRTPKKSKPEIRLSDKKIGGFSVNPMDTNEVATASLDRSMKIWDLRRPYQLELGEKEEPKGAFLNAVYKSRLSISATSWNTDGQIVCNGYDNTINVFNMKDAQIDAKDGNLEIEPAFTHQHNCQTGRWVSILKARWQENPKDGFQKFVIGNMKRYADVFSGTGEQLAHLDTDFMTAVPAVAQFHPTLNWVVGGNSSGKVYLWKN